MRNILALALLIISNLSVGLKLVPLVSDGLEEPVDIVADPDHPNKFYVVEQKGRIQIVENGKIARVPLLDIESKIISGGEMGLLGLALHPKFSENKRYFVNYTVEKPNLKTIIAEYQVGRPTEKEILEYAQPFENHNGGGMAFDKAGLLYITSGDGGSGGDPFGNSQNKSTFLGKILRIDIDKGDRYEVPKDNPFLNEPNAKKEIYAYGLRNVWRFSFDRLTGALFAGDVGQNKWEEIDLIEKGGNYGWKVMEAKHCFSPSTQCNQTGLTLPLFEYPRNEGISVTGGYVYRGKEIPDLYGIYIYGDFGSGKIWGLAYDQSKKKVIGNNLLLDTKMAISSFGEDNNGELLVLNYAGQVYRLSK